jgi:iron complex transport system ATP-binding protein
VKDLAVKGLTFDRGRQRILEDVSLELMPGRILALTGPNGSGKSTLLRCMAGLLKPSAGTVTCFGCELHEMSRSRIARHVTYVPQETSFSFPFPVREIVMMGRYAHRGRFDRPNKEDRDAMHDAICRTDVLHLADRPVTALSGGEKQRVLIARGLAANAPILLLDEPAANLDVRHALDILGLCRSLAREGRSIAIATHDLNSVFRFADQVALLESGRVVASGMPHSVMTSENLARVFNVESEILHGPESAEMLWFRRRAGV